MCINSQGPSFRPGDKLPEFPGKLDAELVQKGADIFHERTFPKDWDNLELATGVMGTIPKLATTPTIVCRALGLSITTARNMKTLEQILNTTKS